VCTENLKSGFGTRKGRTLEDPIVEKAMLGGQASAAKKEVPHAGLLGKQSRREGCSERSTMEREKQNGVGDQPSTDSRGQSLH